MTAPVDWSWIDPIAWPGCWGVVVLGGYPTPGHAELTDCERKYKWKVPESMGTSGAYPKYQNELVAKPKLTIKLWDRAQFPLLEAFLAICRKAPDAKEPTALTIEHPEAQRNGINSVVVESLSQLKGDAKNGWTYGPIELIEVRKPVPVAGGAASGGAKAWQQTKDGVDAIVNSNAVKTIQDAAQALYDSIVGNGNETVEGSGKSGSGGPEWIL